MKEIIMKENQVYDYILSDALGKDYLSFAHRSDQEIRTIIDVLGQWLSKCIDIETYIEEASRFKNQCKLIKYYEKNRTATRKKIEGLLETEADELRKKAWVKLLSLKLNKLLFDHNQLTITNGSDYLEVFMFLLGLLKDKWLYIDIYQSDALDFTEIFWLMDTVPKTNWTGSIVKFPPLKGLNRKDALMKKNDDSLWHEIFIGDLQERTRDLYRKAEINFHREDYLEASLYYERALTKEENPFIRSKLAHTYFQDSYLEASYQEFKKVISEGVVKPKTLLLLGEWLYDNEQYLNAQRFLQMSLDVSERTNPSLDQKTVYQMALSAYQLKEPLEAIKWLDDGIKHYPTYVRNYHSKAHILLKLGRTDEVIPTYQHIIALEPTHKHYGECGLLNKKIGRYQEAISNYNKAAELAHEVQYTYAEAKYRARLASCYHKTGQLDESAAEITKAFELDPTETSICLDLMEFHIVNNRIYEVISQLDWFERSVDSFGSSSQRIIFYYLLGLVCLAVGHPTEAIEAKLEELINKLKESQESTRNLVEHYEWYFGHTDTWLLTADLREEQKKKAKYFTCLVKGESHEGH